MSPFTIFALCIQALLIQTVTSQQCISGYQTGYVSAPVVGYSSGYSTGSTGYGGKGTGEVSAAGTIDACGTTCVKGTVPVLGSVTFDGCADACGAVTICGQCGCGCGCQ